jgi:hypothetical protein
MRTHAWFYAHLCNDRSCSHISTAPMHSLTHNICEGPVPCQEGGCNKSEARVLHATIGEGGGEKQQVIAAPYILPSNCLPCSECAADQ